MRQSTGECTGRDFMLRTRRSVRFGQYIPLGMVKELAQPYSFRRVAILAT